MGLYSRIASDPELRDLYQNDATFYTAVHVAEQQNMDTKEALTFALKAGYKAKNEIEQAFTEHIHRCGYREGGTQGNG